MANSFQRIVFNASSLSPILIIFGVLWSVQNKSFTIPFVCCDIGICIILLSIICFIKTRKALSVIEISVTNIKNNDKWVLVFFITYCIPFVTLIIDDINFIALTFASAAIIIVMLSLKIVLPNPFLFVMRYHTYDASTNNGVEYTIVSKRTIRNANQVKYVKRMHEYFLIDEGDVEE